MEQAEKATKENWGAEGEPPVASNPAAKCPPPKGDWQLSAIPYYVLSETPCPYLSGRFERKLLVEVSGPCGPSRYDLLTRAGFRRSHRFAYRPACENCNACVPVRIPVKDFRPTRSLKRIWARNRDLVTLAKPAVATQEHFAIFKSYLRARHYDGEMAFMSLEDYRSMVEESDLSTSLVEFRRADNALLAVLLLDWVGDGSSAVYSFFSPAEYSRSLGFHVVLWLIEETKKRNLDYVYLGYWIRNCRKMAYKTRFHPIEALGPDGWSDLVSG